MGGGGFGASSSVKMRGSGASGASSRVKMGISGTDSVGRVRLALWPAANPGRCSKPAVGGDERLERIEMLKIMVSEAAKKIKICLAAQNGDAPEQNIFLSLEEIIRSGAEI